MRTRTVLFVLLSLALVLAACGGDDDDVDAGGGAAATTVAVASTDLGDALVDGDGMTLYLFLPDEDGAPTCTDACAENWPPVAGPAQAGDGADASLLGTAEHPAGTIVATYGSWPLYRFAGDQAPGDVNGQGVGDKWYVVSPDGQPVRGDDAAAASDPGY